MPTTFPILNEATGELEDTVHWYPEESCKRLRVSRRTLLDRLRSGRWPGLPMGRIWYMTDADIGAAIEIERERAAQRARTRHRPSSSRPAEDEPRPRLGLAVPPEDADRLEGLR